MVFTKPQQWNKEESEQPRGERDQIKFIDLRFERWQVVRFRKARGGQDMVVYLKFQYSIQLRKAALQPELIYKRPFS